MPKLRSHLPHAVTLDPVRASAGVEAWYRARLLKLVDAMHKSVAYWVTALYRDKVDSQLAHDATPATELAKRLKKLGKQWTGTFEAMSATIAKSFVDKAMKHGDLAFKSALKKGGFTIEFTTTPAIRATLDAATHENVRLIRSIPAKYLDEVEGHVLRSVQAGRAMKELTETLHEVYGVTKRRAALIARDQNNKATAHMSRVRMLGLGITTALWSHTMASKEPREEHEEWDGEKFDLDEGMYSEVDGENVWPGTPINCGCTSRAVIPGYNDDEEDEK